MPLVNGYGFELIGGILKIKTMTILPSYTIEPCERPLCISNKKC